MSAPDAARVNQRDLYCPGCGYNLRGLPGEPVRCPECGRMCPLIEIELPAAMIKRRLVRMESASAYSVLFVYGTAGALLLALSNRGLWAGEPEPLLGWGIGVAATGLGLAASLATSRQSCDAHPEWPTALARYHLFGLVLVYHNLFIAAFGPSTRAIGGRISTPTAYLGGLMATLVACGLWAAFTYRHAVSHLRQLQRDVAVRIAREELARFGRRGAGW